MFRQSGPNIEIRPPRRASTLPVRFAVSPENDRQDDHRSPRTRPSIRTQPFIRDTARARTHGNDTGLTRDEIIVRRARRDSSSPRRHRSRKHGPKLSRAEEEIHIAASLSGESSNDRSRSRSRSRSNSRRRHRSRSSSSSSSLSSSTGNIFRESRRPYVSLTSHRIPTRSKIVDEIEQNDSEDESYGSDLDDQIYNFVIPGRTTSLFSQDSTTIASSISAERHDDTAQPLAQGTHLLKPEVTYNVLKSQYSGDGYVGGEHRTDLTVTDEAKRNRSTLFRWVHYHNQSMNFEHFENSVRALPGLSDNERLAVTRLLTRVRSKCDKTYELSNRVKIRVMKYGVLQEAVPRSAKAKQQQAKSQWITWFCLPYFLLSKYSNDLSRLVDWKRESQQAIWYLVLGDTLLVTCSHLPMSSLRGKDITTTVTPSSGSSKPDSPILLVYYGVSVLWSFALDDCQTWFSLITKFSEFWPSPIRLSFQGRTVTPDLWPRIVNNARHTHDNVTLTLQISGNDKLPRRGILRHQGDVLDTGESAHGTVPNVLIDDEVQHASASPVSVSLPDTLKFSGRSTVNDSFCIFAWLSLRGSNAKNVSTINLRQVYQDLVAIDRFLSDETSLDESLAYKRCPDIPRTAILSLLRQNANSVSNPAAKPTTKTEGAEEKITQVIHERRVDAFNAAESIFECFLPLSSEGPTIGKFWGAVATMLQMDSALGIPEVEPLPSSKRKRLQALSDREDEMVEFGGEMEYLLETLRPFRELLSQMPLEERVKIGVPDELSRAWLHIVMCLVFAAQRSRMWMLQLQIAAKLIDRGTKLVMRGLVQTELLNESVVMPREIVFTTYAQLLRDELNPETQRDIVHVYADYFARLKAEIEANPLDRGHQDKIFRLKQEITVIEQILEFQMGMLTALTEQVSRATIQERLSNEKHTGSRAYDAPRIYVSNGGSRRHVTDHAEYSRETDKTMFAIVGGPATRNRITPTDPKGYRELLTQECLDVIRSMLDNFQDLGQNAAQLEEWNLYRIEMNKDRQESAVYIFTIVTVIFLPLSTVASILGMNTNDIRNMQINQWVFWAVALPVTFMIIFLCLVWTGELENLRRWFRFSPRGSTESQLKYSGGLYHRSRSGYTPGSYDG